MEKGIEAEDEIMIRDKQEKKGEKEVDKLERKGDEKKE